MSACSVVSVVAVFVVSSWHLVLRLVYGCMPSVSLAVLLTCSLRPLAGLGLDMSASRRSKERWITSVVGGIFWCCTR